MTLAGIRAEAQGFLGGIVSDAHLDPSTWVHAVNWSCEVLAKYLLLTTSSSSLMPDSDRTVPCPSDILAIRSVVGGRPMKMLTQCSFDHAHLRRPDWETTSKKANAWFWIKGDQIGINGDPQGSILLHYLQRPIEMTADDDTPDARLQNVNPMSLVQLSACYALQLAGDATSMQKAYSLFAQAMALAGMKTRVQMPRVSGSQNDQG